MKKNGQYIVYLLCIFTILLIPFAGMTFWPTNETAEKTELAKWPSMKKDGEWNWGILQDMGTYFEDHFAFREQLVTANAMVRSNTVGSSATDRVIVGENGWLYFNGTLDDYLGKNQMTNRQLFMAAQNLKIMQKYAIDRGAQFLFVSPVNKNTLYNENMPSRYHKAEESNLSRLLSLLSEYDVNYVDLEAVFKEQEPILYFNGDTHWTNEGALLAYRSIMERFELQHETFLNVPFEERKDHVGDISEMLYPKAPKKEANQYYSHRYTVVNDITDMMDPWIETTSAAEENRLLMYRDSFGESLVPFMADEFGQGYFTRYVPYSFLQVDQYLPTHVVVERAERTLRKLTIDIPIMTGPIVPNITGGQIQTDTSMTIKKDNDYYLLQGAVDPKQITDRTEIYLSVRNNETNQTVCYQPFYLSKDEEDGAGFQLYLANMQLPKDTHINFMTVEAGAATIVYSEDLLKNNIK
ncbi:alginate O-acetyltransferase AlgX-related protein [Enterococcus sp. LJL51]|uniref:alginate O-acetyltransferase AlgX-related protein n=1 Tax=Enterococcus sp. LJL51 TaxID=3416656 RepID=UPI003CF4F565